MALVLGRDIAFNLIFPAGMSTIVCARTALLDIQTELIETTTVGSGGFKSFKARKHEWNCSCDGVINVGAGYGFHKLRQHQLDGQSIQVQFMITDTKGGSYLFTGYAIITNTNSQGNYNDAGTFSIEFKGSGAITIDTYADADSPYVTDGDGRPIEDWNGAWIIDSGEEAAELVGDFSSVDWSTVDFL